MEDMSLDEMSFKIRGMLFKIQNELGTKFQEKHYLKALCALLDQENFKYNTEVPFSINYCGTKLGDFRADIVIENQILLELKTTDYITKDHFKQTIRYVEALNLPLAYIINFRIRPLQIKRLFNSSALTN